MRKRMIVSQIGIIILLVCMTYVYKDYSSIALVEYTDKKIIFNDENLETVIRQTINKPTGEINVDDLKGIKELIADNKNISKLDGIEKLVNLEVLSLKQNKIKDLKPIADLKKLRFLNLFNNKVSDIQSLSELKDLKQLDLDTNHIKNIYPLMNLSKLQDLRLGSNQINDIIPLTYMGDLEYLSLWSNGVEDIKPLENLKRLKDLRLSYNEIWDITPLRELNNLETLYLFNNKIEDIYSLSKLYKLKNLYIMENKIQNIEPLKDLVNLEELKLNNNKIIDINPIGNLTHIKKLNLNNNLIGSIEGLRNLYQLKYLDLGENSITNIGSISNLTNLKQLILDKNRITDIIPLYSIKGLTSLILSNNDIKDIGPLSYLSDLMDLDLSNNNISDISPLDGLNKIKELHLDNNNITILSPITNKPKLFELSLSKNNINDISGIEKLKKLEILNIANNNIEDIDNIGSFDSTLREIHLNDNNISNLEPLIKLKNLDTLITNSILDKGLMIKGKITDIYNDEYKGSDTYITIINTTGENFRLPISKSNKYGYFEIKGLSPGRYKMVFLKMGYKPVTIYENIYIDGKELDIKLAQNDKVKWAKKETNRIIYHYNEDLTISDTEINLQENKLEEIEEFFEVEIDDKINFYVCTYPEEIYELAYGRSNYFTLGTYVDNKNSIYTLGKGIDYHETTHAVEEKYNPEYNISLGEGLAIYFGDGSRELPIAMDRPVDDMARELLIKGELKDIGILLSEFQEKSDYIMNGSFIAYLINNYPKENFLELFKLLPRKTNNKEIGKIFNDVYNKSLQEIQDEWEEYLILRKM